MAKAAPVQAAPPKAEQAAAGRVMAVLPQGFLAGDGVEAQVREIMGKLEAWEREQAACKAQQEQEAKERAIREANEASTAMEEDDDMDIDEAAQAELQGCASEEERARAKAVAKAVAKRVLESVRVKASKRSKVAETEG